MKRFLFYVGTITLTLVLVFASMGIVNYVNEQDNLTNTNIENSVSAGIYDLQLEMSSLYLTKSNYETEKAEIEDRLEELKDNDEATNNEITQLSQRLIVVEQEIERLEANISSIQIQIEDLYNSIEAMNKSILTAGNNTYQMFEDSNVHYLNLVEHNSIGSQLSINEDGYFVIGKNVSKVLISFTATFERSSVGSCLAYFYHNEAKKSVVYGCSTSTSKEKFSISMTPMLYDVQENDVIAFAVSGTASYYVESNANSSIYRTFMTIEVVQ